MSKYTCLVLCVLAVSLSGVYAGEEDIAAFKAAIRPIVEDCEKEYGVTDADILKAREAHDPTILKPCFMGCVFKKVEIINDKGDYDVDTGLSKIKKYVKSDEVFAKITEVGKKCASVIDKAVSDGAAGCERATLLATCFSENRAGIPV